MDEIGTDTVDRIVLAGAFGAHISPKHAMVLGMIPDAPLDRVSSAGNAAGTGARMALCSKSARAGIERTVTRIHKVETAIEPRFQEHFVAANALPHATAPFPELSRVVTLPQVSFKHRRKRRTAAQAGLKPGRRELICPPWNKLTLPNAAACPTRYVCYWNNTPATCGRAIAISTG